MHATGKSDTGIVSMKRTNKGAQPQHNGQPPAEFVEKRTVAEGNPEQATANGTQGPQAASSALDRVREAARRDAKQRFTNLLHHVKVDLLRQAYGALNHDAAAGVDEVTRSSRKRWFWSSSRFTRKTFSASVTVFGRNEASTRPWTPSMSRSRSAKVSWVLDADIRGFFDTIEHAWLMKFVEHRVADPRVLRLIRKFLQAGVSEDGQWSKTEVGTPQGAVISPFLANIYLSGDCSPLPSPDRYRCPYTRADSERLHQWCGAC